MQDAGYMHFPREFASLCFIVIFNSVDSRVMQTEPSKKSRRTQDEIPSP
jgi:hypothetical protein